KNLYNNAIKSVVNSEYTIGRRIYFWNQGCNENGYYTADEYEEAFMELHNEFTTNFGAAADTGASQAYPLEYGGILPVRSTTLSSKGNNGDTASNTLKLTGPRIAQYDMARKNDKIFIVADAMERWSSNANIKEWFEEKYEGQAYYGGAENMPYDWISLMGVRAGATDTVHYNQYALNEFGIEAANNMLAHLRAEGTASGIDIITPNGIEHIENGGTITLPEKDGDNLTGTVNGVIPVMPVESGIEGTFTLSGGTAAEFKNGMLIPKAALAGDFSTLKVAYKENGVDKTMEFRVETPLKDTSVAIEVAPIYDNYSAIYTLTTDDGWKATNEWLSTTLASIEEAKGLDENTLKATMGLIVDWMGTKAGVMTWKEAQDLAATGRWDVANHTMAHKQTDFHNLTEEQLEVEINGARAELKKQFPNEKVLGLYTPGGKTSDLIRSIVAEEHLCLRGAGGGTYNPLPLTDKAVFATETAAGSLYTLRVAEVGSSSTVASAKTPIDNAIANNGWLVEMWHAVGGINENAGAYSPVPKAVAEEHLAYIADKAKEGKLWVTTLDEASVYATQRLYTRLSLKSKTDNSMVIGVEDDLDNSIYDAELTINVTLPSGWTAATVSRGGNAIASSVKNGKVIFNTLPDKGDITITKNN
ncbi:MAG: polysaccharide deacetylase family protein, partial [Clostridia bacterium]|nr:polysaccharide deacetylase family protein [Clostridia bacterium]